MTAISPVGITPSFGKSIESNKPYRTSVRFNNGSMLRDEAVLSTAKKGWSPLKKAMAVMLGAGTLLGAVSCQQATNTTPTKEVPEVKPSLVKQTLNSIFSTWGILDPIVEDVSSKIGADTVAGKGFSIIQGGEGSVFENYEFVSADEVAGDITANRTYGMAGSTRTHSEMVTISKADDGFIVKHSDGLKDTYLPIKDAVEKTGVNSSGVKEFFGKLKKGLVQGEVLIYDAADVFMSKLTQLKLRK